MKETAARDINELISSKGLEQDSQKRLLEAELLHRSHQIRNFDRFKYALTREGEDHAATFKRLSTARDQLLERLRRLPGTSKTGVRETLASSLSTLVAPRFGQAGEGPFVFGTEGCVALPRATDGISIAPSSSVAHGVIRTTEFGPLGSLSFDGEGPSLEHPALGVDADFGNEHVWLHNWRYVVLFPCVTAASTLTYKFTVNVNAELFSEASGLIMSFVSVGEEPAASPTSNIVVNIGAGWPLIADVEEPVHYSYNGHYGSIPGSVTVQRTFSVGAERTPAVAIVVGFVARLTSGELRLNFERDSGIGFGTGIGDAGQVCYRYTPSESALPVLAPP
jgi:hypothetical protein